MIAGLRGTPESPVTLRAAHRGRAVIGGAAGFDLRDCENVVLEGFTLVNDSARQAVLLEGCRGVRVTRNTIALRERARSRRAEHWVYAIGAHSGHNRIDHNRVGGKANMGSLVFVRGDDATLACSLQDRIDHNLLHDVLYADGENTHETVRTGSNDMGASGCSSFTVIEDNLLERCSGEEEVMSLKSSDNIVRGNTLLNCRGSIDLRLGNRDLVCGNLVIVTDGTPGSGGVKLYGVDHRVFGNYFEGLTGTGHVGPLSLVPGTMDTPTTGRIGAAYDSLTTVPPTRAWIAFNTWVDCAPLVFGFGPDRRRIHVPDACAFEHNLVARTRPQPGGLVNLRLVRDVRARDNLGFDAGGPAGAGWAGWFVMEDPHLARDAATGLWHPAGPRPVVGGTGVGVEGADAMEGADRPPGAGAPAAGPRRPLTEADVGPDAP